MIGMNDDTRFLTENRHEQLLAEAETRRLVSQERDTVGRSALNRARSLLHGHGRMAVSAPTNTVPTGFERTARSVTDCVGAREHDAMAA